MTLEQIYHFCAAAETLNLTKASEKLFVSRTSISRSIRALEEEYNLVFLVRNSRNITLTPAGQIMLEHCKHLLTSVERMQEDLHQYISTEHHTISLGSSWMTFQSSFFSFCDYFQKNNPDISMPLSLVSPATLMQGICNGKFDIGFTYMLQNFVLPDLLESIPIEDGQMVLAVASDHELAQTFSGKLSDIESYPNVYPTNNVKAIFEIRPPEEATATYVENMSEIGFQILLGRAIAIVPEHSLAWFPPGVIHLPIKENVTRYKVCILYHKKFKNPSTQQFLDEWEMFNKSDKQL